MHFEVHTHFHYTVGARATGIWRESEHEEQVVESKITDM